MTEKIEFTKGSGNVFADLGLDNSDELLAKSTLAITIRKIIKERKLTQAQAARIFGTHQTQVSRLKSGKGVASMSFYLLLSWLTKLDHDVTVSVRQKSSSQAHAGIHVAI